VGGRKGIRECEELRMAVREKGWKKSKSGFFPFPFTAFRVRVRMTRLRGNPR
jgi:hypothetical protein